MQQQHLSQQGSISSVPGYSSRMSYIAQKQFNSDSSFEITQQHLENIFIRHLSFDMELKITKKASIIRLKKPPEDQSQYSSTWPIISMLKNIMKASFNKQEIKFSQFSSLIEFFQLTNHSVKMMSYPDQIILQTLRFAIFNKQQIPDHFVKVIIEMSKGNFVKNLEGGSYFLQTAFNDDMIKLGIQPPLDLYIDFVDAGLIVPSQKQLGQIFTQNSNLFKNQELYKTLGHKKRLIYNQLPYLIDIFRRLNLRDPVSYDYNILRNFLVRNVIFLQVKTKQLFERYLPEIRCRYLKIKQNINNSDLQYLFTTLKSIDSLNQEDIKILFGGRQSQSIPLKQNWYSSFQFKSLIQFWKVQQFCQKILTKKDYHLTKKQLQQIGQLLSYDDCSPMDIIKINMIFLILREQVYNSQQIPMPVFKNLLYIFKKIPDKKKRKQCCYILLQQYLKMVQQNPQKRVEIIKQYSFPEPQLDQILDQGREIALDILQQLNYEKLIMDEEKYFSYMAIVKSFMEDTKNLVYKSKAFDLCKKLNKANRHKAQILKFYEKNLLDAHQFIQYMRTEAEIGGHFSRQSINNIIKVLCRSSSPTINKSCLTTIRHIIDNQKNGQLPSQFQENILKLVTNLYFQEYMTEECREEIIKIVLKCTDFPSAYNLVDLLTSFLLQVYFNSQINSPRSINSSLGYYIISRNFVSKTNFQINRQILGATLQRISFQNKGVFALEDKGKINIMCAFVALANNRVPIPTELIQELTIVAVKYKQLTELALMTVLLHVRNRRSKPISQKSVINIGQMLKNNEIVEIIGNSILEKCLHKQNQANLAKNKTEESTKIEQQLMDKTLSSLQNQQQKT